MTIRDAIGILRGADNAVTQYFRRHSEVGLTTVFQPIISRTIDTFEVTANYKHFVERAGRIGLVESSELDLDEYVTSKALDGLCLYDSGRGKAYPS